MNCFVAILIAIKLKTMSTFLDGGSFVLLFLPLHDEIIIIGGSF